MFTAFIVLIAFSLLFSEISEFNLGRLIDLLLLFLILYSNASNNLLLPDDIDSNINSFPSRTVWESWLMSVEISFKDVII